METRLQTRTFWLIRPFPSCCTCSFSPCLCPFLPAHSTQNLAAPYLSRSGSGFVFFFFFLALRECPIQAPQRVLMVLADFPMAVLRRTPLSEWLLTPHLFCSSTSRWCHTSLDLLIYYIAMVWLSVSSVYISPHLQGDKLFWG